MEKSCSWFDIKNGTNNLFNDNENYIKLNAIKTNLNVVIDNNEYERGKERGKEKGKEVGKEKGKEITKLILELTITNK